MNVWIKNKIKKVTCMGGNRLLWKAIYMYIRCLFDDNFSFTLNISIYTAIGSPGHGKHVVDGQNEIYKSYRAKKRL